MCQSALIEALIAVAARKRRYGRDGGTVLWCS
jgi:hypothetical protein